MRRQWQIGAWITSLLVLATVAIYCNMPSSSSQHPARAQAASPKVERLKWEYELVNSTLEFIDEELLNAGRNYRTNYLNSYSMKEFWGIPKVIITGDMLLIYEQSSATTIYDLTDSQVTAFNERHQLDEDVPEYSVGIIGFWDGVRYGWNEKITALDLSGEFLWCKLNPSSEQLLAFNTQETTFPTSSAKGSDELVRIITNESCLVARDQDGNEVWQAAIEEAFSNTLRMFDLELGADDSTYLLSVAWSKIHAIGPDGKYRWELDPIEIFPRGDNKFKPDNYPNQKLELGMAGGLDGTAYFRSRGGSLAAISSDGAVKWCYRPDEAKDEVDYYISAPVLGPNGAIYLKGQEGQIMCISPEGKRKWVVSLPGRWETTKPVIGSDGTVYVISEATVYALEP